mgnify:CR=1 FL=1
MADIMISTLYSVDPVIAGVTLLGAKKLYLLIDETPNDTQKKGLENVKKFLNKYVRIKTISTKVYDIYTVVKDCVNLIDSIPKSEKIILNISAARKSKAIGLMLSGYLRNERIKKIVYITKEDK